MIFFDREVDVIFIMLGFSCNFKCNYCLQHENKNIVVSNINYNKDIINFCLQQADRNERKLAVHFFGGEPLLYIDIIKDIIERLKHHKNIYFTTVTNGSLITKEIADYFVENDVRVTISWDGRNTKLSRNVDVFETNKDNIFRLRNGFAISSVINHYNSLKGILKDVYELSNEYSELYNIQDDIPIHINIDTLYNLCDSEDDIYNLNYNNIRDEMRDMFYNYIHNPNKNTKLENYYVSWFIPRIKFYKENPSQYFSRCGSGHSMLNLDLFGNLYLCHNETSKKLGSIYDTMEEYLSNLSKAVNIQDRYKEYCMSCSVRFICWFGCPICKIKKDSSYCKEQKAFFEPIIETILEK